MFVRVVIDCFKQVKGAGKSIGIYNVALSLVRNLSIEKVKTDDLGIKDCEIVILGNRYNQEDFDIPNIQFVEITNYDPLNKIQCILWELFGVSKVCKKLHADRMLFPRGYCALTHPVKDIVLIHDLIPFYYDEHFPGAFNKLENAYIMSRLKQSARSAKKIITISEASKADILKYCGVNEDKITVINNACNAVNYVVTKDMSITPYICAITSGLPHKNAAGILKSYEEYRKLANSPIDLHVIGIDENYKSDISEETRAHIHFHKFIKDNNDMYKLISNAKIFLFLSLIEGFGLPLIEAMQLEVPVICSNTSSLPEVVGDAAILVDPEDFSAVGKAIFNLQEDEEERQELVDKGKENVKRFSWDGRAKLYWSAILK